MFKRLQIRLLKFLIPKDLVRLPTSKELEVLPKDELFGLWKVVSSAWTKKNFDFNVERMKAVSEGRKTKSLLAAFLYILIRDQVPLGRIEQIVLALSNRNNSDYKDDLVMTNGWLLDYCEDVAERLLNDSFTAENID
jgi:hypothetical protein